MLYYPDDLEAYNSAKWTGIELQPAPAAPFFQDGIYTYLNRSTSKKTAARRRRSSSNSGILIGVGGVVVADPDHRAASC